MGIALIVCAAILAYLPSINGEFVLDDDKLLTDNPLIMAPDGLYRFWCTTETLDYWPVTNTTFWIEWRLWGMHSTGYHVTNLILHITASLLIWVTLRKLSVPGAFLAAMIFTVHPVNVESVAWIAQRKNTLAMLFFLLSILWYLKYFLHSSHPSWYWLSLAAFLLAMLSKGSVAILPVLLLWIVWWQRPLTKWDLARTAPFFIVAVLLAGVNMWFQTHGSGEVIRSAGFTERLLGAGGVIWFYLYKALMPINLVFIYPQWHIEPGKLLWWLPLLAALALTAVLWLYRQSWSRPLLFAWGFFCVALAPVMGFVDIFFMRYSLVADHYQHIAIIAVIAPTSALWSTWHQSARKAARWAAMLAACMAVGSLIFLSWRQSGLYRDEITLYQDTLQKNPDCWIVHYNLGCKMFNTGRLRESMEHFQQALQGNADFPDAHSNLGSALVETGRYQEAIEHCKKALSLQSDFPEAHYNLGNALFHTGRTREAIEHYEQAIRLKPDYSEALNNFGFALIQTGRPREAIDNYEKALRLKPNYPEAHNNLGNALVQIGRPLEAIDHYQQAMRLKPDYPEARYNMGNTLLQSGRPLEAIEHFKQALRLKPDYPEAQNNLGIALVNAGQLREAIECFRQTLRLKSDFPDAYYNLALAYASLHQSAEAVASARKALELARSKGQIEQARQIEDWLNAYPASPSSPPTAPLSSEPASQAQ